MKKHFFQFPELPRFRLFIFLTALLGSSTFSSNSQKYAEVIFPLTTAKQCVKPPDFSKFNN